MVRASGIKPVDIRWLDEKRSSSWENNVVLLMQIVTVGDLGIDENLTATPLLSDGVTEDLTKNQETAVRGLRTFTLRLRVESFDTPIDNPNFAANVLERAITRLRRNELQELRAGVFSIDTMSKTSRVEYVKDDRTLSCYVRDLMCSTCSLDVDTDPQSGSWIGAVESSTSHVYLATDSTGATIESPTQAQPPATILGA